jgi:Ca-activated chloride channel family protein
MIEFIKQMDSLGNLFHFAAWYNLPKVLIIGFLIIWWLLFRYFKIEKLLSLLSQGRQKFHVLKKGSRLVFIIKALLLLIGFISLLIALLQPQWGKKDEQVSQQGRDILIAVDISRSMLCSDEKPNRLEFAKQKIKKILYNLKCDRVGLIVFAGDAVMQCPLTVDYAAFFMFLDNLDVSTISSGTTSLDGALHAALDAFKQMPDKKTKLLCLFTDGEDFSTNLATVKEQAAKEGLSIFTFGVGSSRGAPIPVLDQKGKNIGFEKDSTGKVIMSKFNEGILKNLSKQTGGQYIKTTHDDADIQKFLGSVEKFEKDSLGSAHFNRYQEQYSYFIIISFICFGLEWVL